MSAYLEKVVINGICTNVPLLRKILKDEIFIQGRYDTSYLDDFLERIDFDEMSAEIEEASGGRGIDFDIETLKIAGSEELRVLSPSAGIFYRAPSPSEPEYVNEGDIISTEDVLCQLEAMKMFTPMNLNSFSGDGSSIYRESTKYEITRINMANGQQVNEGDLLFVIRKYLGEEE